MYGIPIHTTFYFLLLLCLMSTQFLDWIKNLEEEGFLSSPTSHLRLLALWINFKCNPTLRLQNSPLPPNAIMVNSLIFKHLT